MVKILVVDDEADILESVKMLLEVEGYEVVAVNTGAKALNRLKKEKFNLVLLDILMPKMSGIEVLRTIRAESKLKNTNVAFLTVVDPSKNGSGVLKKLNPVAYIQKPIDIGKFKRELKSILKD